MTIKEIKACISNITRYMNRMNVNVYNIEQFILLDRKVRELKKLVAQHILNRKTTDV